MDGEKLNVDLHALHLRIMIAAPECSLGSLGLFMERYCGFTNK